MSTILGGSATTGPMAMTSRHGKRQSDTRNTRSGADYGNPLKVNNNTTTIGEIMKYNRDGYTLTAYSTMYMDYGLTITKDGRELFSNPHVFSNESYGSACQAECEYECECEEQRPWTDKEWSECLESEFNDLIEAYLGPVVSIYDDDHCRTDMRHYFMTVDFTGDLVKDKAMIVGLLSDNLMPILQDNDIITDYHSLFFYRGKTINPIINKCQEVKHG
jgi:hypothetical protein